MKRLKTALDSIDHKGYPAYKSLKGSYQFGIYTLHIDKVQGDPFASPSRISLEISGGKAGFPAEYYQEKHRRIALEDHLLRLFYRESSPYSFKAKGSGKSGLIAISRPGQEVIERSACHVNEQNGDILLRLAVGFPANGRSINAGELYKILYQFLPKAVEKACVFANISQGALQKAIDLADDQKYIRDRMQAEGLVAFVANDAILPRESGVSERPMKNAVPFHSPASMEVTWDLPHKGTVTGMGDSTGYHFDRGWRLSWQVHLAADFGKSGLSAHFRGWQGVCGNGEQRGKDPLGGWTEYSSQRHQCLYP